MATAAEPVAGPAPRRASRTRFYFHLSLACLAVGVLGFTPTYWSQLPGGTFTGSPLLHIHGFVFTAWLLLLVGQNWRIVNGRVDLHRGWGMVGIALATAIFLIGTSTAIVGLRERYEQGLAEQGRVFLIAPLYLMMLFYGFFIAAMANLRRPDWHRRFVFVATAAMLVPPIARFLFTARNGWAEGLRPGNFPPGQLVTTTLFMSLASLIVVAGMIHDWRTDRRVHPAWWIGLFALTIGGLLRIPVASTTSWHAFADWTTRIV